MKFFSLVSQTGGKKNNWSFIVFGSLLISIFFPSLLELFSFTVSVLLYDIRIDFAGFDYRKECRP